MSKSNPARLWRFGRKGALIFTQNGQIGLEQGYQTKIIRSTVRCFGDAKQLKK